MATAAGNWEGYVSKELTNVQLLTELEPEVERLLNRHLAMFKEWHPHDYVPWSDGSNFMRWTAKIGSPGKPIFRMSPRWRWSKIC